MDKSVHVVSEWSGSDKSWVGSIGPSTGTKTAVALAVVPSVMPKPLVPEAEGPFTDTTIGYLVRDVHRSLARSLQSRIASHGVSMGQWFFLRALWDEDGLTQRELSQRVGMMEPTTVTALNGMERRGLVERVRNVHDRRKVNIYLTVKGRALRDVLLPCSVDVTQEATLGVSKVELSITMDVLRRMAANLTGHSTFEEDTRAGDEDILPLD